MATCKLAVTVGKLRRASMSAVLLLAAPLAAGCSADTDSDELASTVESELRSTEVVQNGTTLRVTATSLNLRSAPSTNARIVASLAQGEVVTCTQTSGEDGWVRIATSDGEQGWAFGKYLQRQGPASSTGGQPVASGGGTPAISAATCDPSRASGVVSRYQKALHDAIAYAEGTRSLGRDGYDIIFSGRRASSCRRHPNQCIAFGNTCSTAAGRYQFLTTTWNSVASARSLGSFEPEDQERGASYLVSNVRRVTVPQNRPLSATEFSNAMAKLSYEWASLPPGRYGQPSKTMGQVRALYCNVAGC